MDLELNWQENKSFQECCRYMLESGLFADTVLVAKSVNGQLEELLAHRFVLVCYSPILQQELCGTTLNSNGLYKVTVNDISLETLKDVLRFMYHGEITPTDENIVDLLHAADVFKIWKLHECCRDYIFSRLKKDKWSPEKRLQFFTECLENNLEEFANYYLLKLRLTSSDLYGPEFLRLPHSALQKIIGSDHLCISAGHTEAAVLRACIEWARERCRVEGKDMTVETCRDVLGDGLYRVRLPLLSLQEFAQEVTGSHLLSNGQKVKVMEQSTFNKDDVDGSTFDDVPRLCFVQGPDCDLFLRSDIDSFGSSEAFELHQIVMESDLYVPTFKINDENGTIISWELDSPQIGRLALDFHPPLKLQGSKRYTIELIRISSREGIFGPRVPSIRNYFKALLIKPMQAVIVHVNLLFNSKTKQSWIVMESNHTNPICIRHIIEPNTSITNKKGDQKVLIWTSTYKAGFLQRRMQLFTCGFNSMEDAACFKAAFTKAKLARAGQFSFFSDFSRPIGLSTTQSQDKANTGLMVPCISLSQVAPTQSLRKTPVVASAVWMAVQPVPKDSGVSTTQPQDKLEPASHADGSVATSASMGSQPVQQDAGVSTTQSQDKLKHPSQDDGSVATSASMTSPPVPQDASDLTTHLQDKLEHASQDDDSVASPTHSQGSAALANDLLMTMPNNMGFVNVTTSTTDQGGLVTGNMNPEQGTKIPPDLYSPRLPIQEVPMLAAAIHNLQDQPASGLSGPGDFSSPEDGASQAEGQGSASSATTFPMAMPNKMEFGNLASGQTQKASPAKHGPAEDGNSDGENNKFQSARKHFDQDRNLEALDDYYYEDDEENDEEMDGRGNGTNEKEASSSYKPDEHFDQDRKLEDLDDYYYEDDEEDDEETDGVGDGVNEKEARGNYKPDKQLPGEYPYGNDIHVERKSRSTNGYSPQRQGVSGPTAYYAAPAEGQMAAAAMYSPPGQAIPGMPGPGYFSSPERPSSVVNARCPMQPGRMMQGANLSQVASPAKHGAAENGDSEGQTEEENTCTKFRPLVSLPVVEVVTGEEQETPLFSERAKLFGFIKKQWMERGLGVLKILHNKDTNSVRLLMRRDQVHKVCANHKVKPDMTIAYKAPGDDKFLTWRAVDFTDGEPRLEQFACKFKTTDTAAAFKSSFEKAINTVKAAVPGTVLASPATQPMKTAQGQAKVPAPKSNTVVSAARPEAVSSSAQKTPVATTNAAGGFSFKPATTVAFCQNSASSMLQSIAAHVGMKNDVSSEEAATEKKPTFGGFTFSSKPDFHNDQIGTPKVDAPSPATVPQEQVTAKPNPNASFTFSPPKTAANVPPFANTPVSEADKPNGQSRLFGTVTSSSPASFASLASKATPPVSSKDSSGKAVVPSSEAASPGRAANESGVEEYEPDVDFKPIVTLLEAVDIKTGEEEEEKVFCQKAKLFRMDPESKLWKERGVGELNIMRQNSTNKYRIVMRRDHVLKLCANHYLSKDMKLLPMVSSDKAWCWYAQDFSEEEIKSEQLSAKFKTPDIATMFKEAFEESVQKLTEVENEAPDVTPEVSTTGPQADPKTSEGGSLASRFKTNGSQAESKAGDGGSLASIFKEPGDWKCNICYVKNTTGAFKCVACEMPKPGSETPQSSEVSSTTSISSAFGTKASFNLNPPAQGLTNVSFGNVSSTSTSSSVSKLTSDDRVTESSTVSLTSGVKGFSLASQPGTGIGPFSFGSTPTPKEQSVANEVKKTTVSKQTGGLQLQLNSPAPFTFAPTPASKEHPDSIESVQDSSFKLFGGFGIPSKNAQENNILKENEMVNIRRTTEIESSLFKGNAELRIFDVGCPSLNLPNLETKAKFKPPSGQDTLEEGDATKNINTRHMCITAMEEYQNQSLEELRSNYYASNKNNCNAGCSSGEISLAESLFGDNRHSSTTRQVNFGENTIEFCFGGVGSTLFGPSAVGGNSAGISGSN